MSRLRRARIAVPAALIGLATALVTGIPGAAQASTAQDQTGATVRYLVHDGVANGERMRAAGISDFQRKQGKDLVVNGDRTTAATLRDLGLRADMTQVLPAVSWAAPHAGAAPQDETYYGGYHTVNAHYANMDAAVKNHPDLAKEVTYGQSWRKQHGAGGYDLKAICITKISGDDCALNPNSKKPRFLLQSQVHAREIATGEISYNWINYLVNGYGKNPAVTKLMDSTELWVVPIVNPDGVDIVQRGGNNPTMHRKNADFTDAQAQQCGDNSFSQPGVDINRNFSYGWQSDPDVCSQTTSSSNGAANSEPETTALESLWTNLFGDHRKDGSNDPVDSGARGTALMLHSDAGLVILPWEYTHATHTPNDAAFRAIGKQLSTDTGYQYGQAGEILYDATGGSDDYAYGNLGIASFTIELGDEGSCTGFAPAYSCVASTYWPKMQHALTDLANKAPAPYTN